MPSYVCVCLFCLICGLASRNPAVIADNVGDNVGDIAGMGSDLFGSFAESTCSALILASVSSMGKTHDYTALLYPLVLSASSIMVCLVTSLLATTLMPAREEGAVQGTLKVQLVRGLSCGVLELWVVGFGLWVLSRIRFRVWTVSVKGCRNLRAWHQNVAGEGPGLWVNNDDNKTHLCRTTE
jgi:Na+/H+-translocating membrane pyrophosphatase